MSYFSNTYRLGQCCQFYNTGLAKLYNPGTVTKTYAEKSGGKEKVQNKALDNALKLHNVLKEYFSKQPEHLRSFRISSDLFPCFTLDIAKEWYEEIMPKLSAIMKRAGDEAKKNNIRLSTHPGQYTVLGSNNPNVVTNSVKDLEYHALYGKLMDLPAKDFVMNIHLQGLYGGKHEDGIKRFATHFHYLSDYAQQCLAVENEDKPKSGYDIHHVLELCSRIPTRATLDVHHYECMRQKDCEYPSIRDDFFVSAVNTWKDTRPLFHVSQTIINTDGSDGSRMNQHSDILHDRDRLAKLLPLLEYADFEVEAKNKEVAVQDAFLFLKEEAHYSGEPITAKTFS